MLTLKECVQKQMAKPLRTEYDGFMITYRCPCCFTGRASKVGSVIIGNKSKYCSDCGQKLDWSEI